MNEPKSVNSSPVDRLHEAGYLSQEAALECKPRLVGTRDGAATGSAVCSECGWTNVNLLNLGEPGKPRMVCHGCCKRTLEAVDACRAALKPNAGGKFRRGSDVGTRPLLAVSETGDKA